MLLLPLLTPTPKHLRALKAAEEDPVADDDIAIEDIEADDIEAEDELGLIYVIEDSLRINEIPLEVGDRVRFTNESEITLSGSKTKIIFVKM